MSNLLARDRYQRLLFLFFLLFFTGSCINPPYRQFLLMQHVPTVLAALLLAYLSNRFFIGRWSFSSIIVFMCLHTLGGTLFVLIRAIRYQWLVAVVFTPHWAEQFLGQQGDIFDAQKDTALASAGAVVSICVNP